MELLWAAAPMRSDDTPLLLALSRRMQPYLAGAMRTRLQDSGHRTDHLAIERTLDFRDAPVRTPRQNPVHASWPAACAANWARNVAVAPSTLGFRARPYWQIRRPCCSRWYLREPDSGGRRSLPAPCGSLAHIPHCTTRSTL